MKHPAAVLLGALLVGALPASAQRFDVPPLVVPSSSEHHVGKVIWADLSTPDLVAAEKFYSGLFGWTFRELRGGDRGYVLALLGGRPVAGLFQRPEPSGERKRPAWLAFLAVRDVDATKATALAHGARLVFEPRTYAQRGRQAVFADPEGAVFAVLASTSGDPADFLAAPGDWIWSALLAKEPDTEAAFYQTLFGYDVFELPTDDGLQHVILSSDDFARAGVNHFPEGSAARRHTHWVNFVRVLDASASAAKAVELGGRILVEPHMDRHGANVALVADPAGALVGLMEWSDAEGMQKEPK
jgi:predicted enzyme related to lactoylglutathione lyase